MQSFRKFINAVLRRKAGFLTGGGTIAVFILFSATGMCQPVPQDGFSRVRSALKDGSIPPPPPGFVFDAPPAQSIADLKKQTADLQRQIDLLRTRIFENDDILSDTAVFDTTSPNKFASVRTSVGQVLIVFKGASKYLNGYRAAIEIGNPHSGKISQYDVSATWSSNFSEDRDHDIMKWFQGKKHKTVQYAVPLEPGRWTKLWIVLPNTSAAEFESMEIKVNVLGVELDISPASAQAVQ